LKFGEKKTFLMPISFYVWFIKLANTAKMKKICKVIRFLIWPEAGRFPQAIPKGARVQHTETFESVVLSW